jgi:hypothetical protein
MGFALVEITLTNRAIKIKVDFFIGFVNEFSFRFLNNGKCCAIAFLSVDGPVT